MDDLEATRKHLLWGQSACIDPVVRPSLARQEFAGFGVVERLELRRARLLQAAAPPALASATDELDAAAPDPHFRAAGYDLAHHGQGQWNGVAILAKGVERGKVAPERLLSMVTSEAARVLMRPDLGGIAAMQR